MADELDNKKNIDDSRKSLDDFNDAMRDSIDYARELNKAIKSISVKDRDATRGLANSIKSYSDALRDTLKLSDKVAKGKAKQEEINKQAISLQTQYNRLLENRSLFESENSEILQRKVQLQGELETLAKNETKLIERQLAQNQKIEAVEKQISAAQKKRYKDPLAKAQAQDLIKELKKEQKERLKNSDNINQQLTLGEKLMDKKREELEEIDRATNSYEELKSLYETLLELQTALTKEAKEQTILGKLRSKDIKKQAEGFKELLSFAGSLGAIFKPILDFAFKISEQTTQLQKNLVLSQSEARVLRKDFNSIAVSSGDIAINTARLVEANAALGQQLGFSSKFTADLNVQFVKLTKQIGLSEEAAGGLAKLSIATGTTLEESKNIALGTSQALSSQYGIQLNQREVLEEIGKVSGQTLAMLKASPQAIAAAVAQAKLLGTNLDTAAKQAKSLLDFETSIQNELQAELLTGQQFNLERARSAALTGDLTTAMKELTNQNIDFNKFSNMNVIAQEKVASALGLSADELSDQLLKQQYMNMSQEQVAALAGEEVAKRVEAISAQDKFNLAMEKMQDIIGRIVGGPLGKFIDGMASLVESSTILYGILGAMAGISLVKLISSIVTMSASLAASGVAAGALTAFLNPVGLAIGIAALAGLGALIGAAMSDASESATPTGDMFSSNGKTLVSPKEGGLFSLSNNDEFAAAPGLGDMISNANRQTIVTQDNSALIEEIRALKNEMSGTKEGISQLNNKQGIVKINGQVAGTAQMMGNYNLA